MPVAVDLQRRPLRGSVRGRELRREEDLRERRLRAGRCVPACTGAVCPTGQRCEAGACADIPPDPVPDLGGGARDLAAPEEGGGSAAIGGCSCQVGQAGEAGAGATGISGLLLAVAVLCRRGRGRERR